MDLLNDFDLVDEEEVQNFREARINRAFEESKASYQSERVVVSPGWFNSPLSVSDRLRPSGRATQPSSQTLHEIEWSLQQLYLQQRYEECLSMAKEFLEALKRFSTRDPNEPKQELRRRELLDIGMRSALKLGRFGEGCELADHSRPSWRTIPGVAAIAAEVYVQAGRPFDAISAILSAFASRGALYPYLVLLGKAFSLLESQASQSDPRDRDRILAAHSFRDAVEAYAARICGSFGSPLFSDEAPRPAHTPWAPLSEKDVAEWCCTLNIATEDSSRLVALCCQQQDSQDTEEPRSVRTL